MTLAAYYVLKPFPSVRSRRIWRSVRVHEADRPGPSRFREDSICLAAECGFALSIRSS